MKRLSICVLLGVILVSVISAHEVALVVPPIGQIPAFNSSNTTRSPVELILDDGSSDIILGTDYQFLWFNVFTPDPADFPFHLQQILIVFGDADVYVGDLVDLVVYEDVNGGDPGDAVFLLAHEVAIQFADQVTWNDYTLPEPLHLTGPGTVLIGVINRYTSSAFTAPLALDTDYSQQHSWISMWGELTVPDPPVLPGDSYFTLIDDQGYPGNFLIRGYGETDVCVNHGDVSLDGSITAGDAQMAFSIVLGLYTPTYEEECAADCTGDGTVTAGDAQSIFYAVLGIGECADPLVTDTPTPPQTPTPTPTPFGGCTGGDLISTDPIVGNMRCAPSGTFTQGSPDDEPCRLTDEKQFTHTLTRNLAVMETEITRQMWANLKVVQPTLPVDPSNTTYSPSLSHPIQSNTWYESVLFANLLSLQNGYTRCYYTDAGFTTPIDATNYLAGPFYCNFNANGYRLPTEGEWEYFTRAGTTTAFSCNETNYTSGNCSSCTPGTHPVLEQYCVYCANNPGRDRGTA